MKNNVKAKATKSRESAAKLISEALFWALRK